MLILAFETSAKAASAALLEDGKLLAESYQNTGLTHSQTLMVMAENLLHQCGKTVNDVNAVAVAAGPGSFTGVRIGVAAVKGMAQGLGKGCVGVSTLEGLAWNFQGLHYTVCPVMDYFEIFLERMLLCRKAAEYFQLSFRLEVNGQTLL